MQELIVAYFQRINHFFDLVKTKFFRSRLSRDSRETYLASPIIRWSEHPSLLSIQFTSRTSRAISAVRSESQHLLERDENLRLNDLVDIH